MKTELCCTGLEFWVMNNLKPNLNLPAGVDIRVELFKYTGLSPFGLKKAGL